MPSLNSLIDSKFKAPYTQVKFNGATTQNVLSVAVNTVLEGSIGSATIRCARNPGINPEAKVTIKQGYNGQAQLTFTGYVDTIEPNESDGSWTLSCRDVLKKALDTFLIQEIKFGHDTNTDTYAYSTYTSTDGGTFTIHEYPDLASLNAAHPETTGNYSGQGVKAEAVVQWLLHMSGLAEGSEIQVDATNFYIGDITPARFHLTSVYDAAQQIANLIGWRIYADASGVARFKKKPRQPGGYSYWKYTDKGSPFNMDKLTKTSTNIDLRNYVEVRGASGIRTVKRASSQYIGNTPYRGVLISEELIDTPGIAEFIATRVLQDLNRLKITIALEADGNPLLTPGSTIDIRSNIASGKYLVENYQTNMSADGGYKASIAAAAYLGDTQFEEPLTPDIVASFVPTFVSVLGDPKWVVHFDASASYSSQGLITRYVWTWPDSSVTDSSDSQASYVFDQADIIGGNSQNVHLVVYDAIGNLAYTDQAITTSGLTALVSPKYRAIYGALTTQAVGTIDGGQAWYTSAIPATSVAASNFAPGGLYVTSGHALFGTSDGKIYKTIDTCVTMTQVYSPGGIVTDVHIPELDSTKAAAVTSTGKVLYSDTAGDTWREIGSFAFPLREVKMNYTNFKELTIVGSGNNNVFITEDTGANWNYLGVGAYDVLWATDGSATNYFAHTHGVLGSGPAGTAALTFSGGSNPSVPAATVMIDHDDGVMIVDSAGQHWVASSGVFNPTQDNSGNKTKHMIRDGEMGDIVYYATASGISKSINRNETMQELYYPIGSVPTGGWGQKVAYGPLAGLAAPGQLIHRGHLDSNNGIGLTGWQIATSSGWIHGCTDVNGAIHAVTTGGVAIYKNDTDALAFIEAVPASGTSTTGIGGLVLHDDWAFTDSGSKVNSMAFSGRHDSRDMLCMITVSPGLGTGLINAQALPHFTTVEGQTAIAGFIQNGGALHYAVGQSTNSIIGDMVFAWNYTLFGFAHLMSVQFMSDGTFNTASSYAETSAFPTWCPRQKFGAPFAGIATQTSEGIPVYVSGYDGSNFVATPLPEYYKAVVGWGHEVYNGSTNLWEFVGYTGASFQPQLWGSYAFQSRIYMNTLPYQHPENDFDTEPAGLYRVDSYGQVDREMIFNPTIVSASGGYP